MKLSQKSKNFISEQLVQDPTLQFVIAAKSDHYPAAHFRAAILCSFSASMLLYFIPWNFHDPIWYLYVQVPALMLGYILASSPTLKSMLSTNGEKKEEVYQMALETYHDNVPVIATNRLLYLSLLEGRLEYISLHHHTKEEEQELRGIIKSFVRTLKKKSLDVAIQECLPKFINKNQMTVINESDDTLLKSEPLEIGPSDL